MPELVVIARARCQAGKEEEMAAALVKNAAATRQLESACKSYSVLRGTGDRTAFATVERWSSKEDLDEHMKSAHVQELFGALGPCLAGAPEIEAYEEL